MTEWVPRGQELERLLRLRTFPLGLTLLRAREDLERVKCARPETISSLCQLITRSRTAGTTIGFTVTDIAPLCATVVGLKSVPPDSFLLAVGESWFKDRETALEKYAPENFPRIPHEYEAAVLSPLAAGRLEPDMVLLYGSPAQMTRLVCGLQWEHYEKLKMTCCGESSCSDSIGLCYTTGKPAVAIPCFGERKFGHAQDDELMAALPPGSVDTLIAGLKALDRVGIRYPIVFAGAQADLARGFPPRYWEETLKDNEYEKNRIAGRLTEDDGETPGQS